MKTAYMGEGKVIVSTLSHPKIKGILLRFHKSKKQYNLKDLVDVRDVGKGLFQMYFPNKDILKIFITQLSELEAAWDDGYNDPPAPPTTGSVAQNSLK